MDAKTVDEILAIDRRIRYVGVLDDDLKTVVSKTREDGKLKSEKEDVDSLLANLTAPAILATLSRFTNKCGKLICAGVRFDEITLLFFKINEMYVVASTEPGPPYITMQRIEERFRI